MPSTDFESFVVGFVSSGNPHSRMHLRTLEVLPEVGSIHLCGLEGEDIAALTSESSKIVSVTDSLEDLLSADVDALLISTRNDQCEVILDAAIESEKPAIFEKPGALTAARMRKIAEAAREKNLTMGTMLNWRNNPMILDAKQALDGGALGEVMAVEARVVTSQVGYRDPNHWLFDKGKAGSGILSWLGCHHIDLLSFLLDDRIESVAAMVGTKNPYPINVEDTAGLVFRFSRGVIGTLHAGYHLVGSTSGYSGAAYDSFLAIRGTEGSIRMPMSESDGYTLTSIAERWASDGAQNRTFVGSDSPAYGGVAGEEFVRQFLIASSRGTPALAPIESIAHVLEVIEAAIVSSETGRTVDVG